MKNGLRHLGATLVALYCGVWVGFAPILPQLHQALAHHHHVFCAEHHRIEDVEPDASGTESDASAGTEARLAASRVPPRTPSSLLPCSLSNFVVQLSAGITPQSLAPASFVAREVTRMSDVGAASVDVLRLAPKHSPPFLS